MLPAVIKRHGLTLPCPGLADLAPIQPRALSVFHRTVRYHPKMTRPLHGDTSTNAWRRRPPEPVQWRPCRAARADSQRLLNADVREVAQRTATINLDFDLNEGDAHAYQARTALGFEPLAKVFPDPEKLATVPVFTTAALLVSYRRHGTDWWDYLNTIENALETAAPLSEDVVPALLLLSRTKRPLSK